MTGFEVLIVKELNFALTHGAGHQTKTKHYKFRLYKIVTKERKSSFVVDGHQGSCFVRTRRHGFGLRAVHGEHN